ncbi:filamentous hemagglutinin N-terminal domain-containing protein, partial [Marinimicrobium sp. UBA4509]
MTLPSSRANTLLSFSKRKLYMAMLACSPLVLSQPAAAGPEGGRITGGSGQISAAQKQMLIEQYSDRIAIDWDSFDLDADEVVSFLQPGADSVALNRILSESASDIRGRINANGHVVLVNPRGIVFGESAQVNVGGLLASGLDIGVDDFMNGDFAFSELDGAEGAVINQGTLQASLGGSIGLLGKTVTNEGLIRAELGSVTLAAGKEAVLTFDSDGLMGIRVTESILQDELGVDPAVVNEGSIEAKGGRVLLTASASRDVFSQAVNTGSLSDARSVVMHDDGSFTLGEGANLVNTGEIRVGHSQHAGSAVLLGENVTQSGLVEANAENGDGGRIELNARSTTLLKRGSETQAKSSTGGHGGEVMALGRYVGAETTASVDASGAEGGGHIYLGGDYRGENPWLPNAEKTIVQAEAELKASATASGDGGLIIVWADESTRFGGYIEAAGASDGLGGFAEVSGKKQLAFSGTADLSGARGAGTLLLDPEVIEIVDSGNDSLVEGGAGSYGISFEDGGEEFQIDPRVVEALLESGSNVTLEATESILVSSALNADGTSSGTWLKFHSGGNIGLAKTIFLGQGSFEAIAGHPTCGDAICQGEVGNRTITLSAGTSIDSSEEVLLSATDTINLMSGGEISGSSITLRSRNNINVGANLISEAGNIQVHAGDSSLDVQGLSGDPVGDLTITGNLNSGGSDVLLNATGNIELRADAVTEGGRFQVGDAVEEGSPDARPLSFSNFFYDENGENGQTEGVINTGTEALSPIDGDDTIGRKSGDIYIYARDGVALGEVNRRYNVGVSDSAGGPSYIGTIHVDNGGDFTLGAQLNFNHTGESTWEGGNGESLGQTEFYVNSEGSIYVDANELASPLSDGSSLQNDTAMGDSWGDARDSLNIDWTAGDTIYLNKSVFTSGGNVDLKANSIQFSDTVQINTDRANSLEEDRTGVQNGNARRSNGGNVDLTVSQALSLGTIVTDGDCAVGTCVGNLTIKMDFEETQAGSFSIEQNAGSRLEVAGDFLFGFTNESAVVNLDFSESGNQLHGLGADHSVQVVTPGDVDLFHDADFRLNDADIGGTLSVVSRGSINVGSVSDLTLGTISTQQEGQNGSNITIDSAGSLLLESGSEINASAGSRTSGGPGYNGGFIQLSAAGDVTLDGRLMTQGGSGYDDSRFGDGENGGVGGEVEITSTGGNIALAEVDASGGDGHSYSASFTTRSNPANGGDAGDITVTPASEIILTGDLLASGGALSAHDENEVNVSHGAGGNIDLNGNVSIAAPSLVIRTDAGPIDADGLAEDSDIQAGDFTITGTLDAENPGSLLTLHTGTTTFDGAIGASGTASLTELTINSYGDVQFGGGSAPVADQIQVNAVGFNEQSLVLTNTDNRWVLRDGSESDSSITFNEDQDPHFAFNGFASLTGGSGVDHFTVSHSDAVYTISGGGGDNNTLSAYTEDAHSWSLSSDDAGNRLTSASEASTDITFSGIQTLEGSGADTLAGRDQDNAWSVVSAGGGRVQRHLESGAAQDVVNFSGMATLVGRGQKDIFTVEVGGSIADIQGGEGDNELRAVSNVGDTVSWTLNGENSGGPVIREFGESEPRDASTLVTTFSDIQNLTGSDGSDQFLVQGDASLSGVLDGGAGANNLDFSAWEGVEGEALNIGFGTTDFTWNLKGINEVTGNGGDSTLGLAYGSNVWTIDQANGGTISHAAGEGESGLFAGDLTFTNFGNLQGGYGDDEFTLTSTGSISGTIDGGSESGNTLTVAGAGNVWRWDHDGETQAAVSQDENVRVGAFSDFQTLTGSGSDQFYGHDQTTYWTLSTDNRWSLSSSEAEADGYLTLSGMNNVTGGTGDDHFTLQNGATYTGEIDGGAQADGSTSTNTLAINGNPSLWHLDGRTEDAVVERGNDEHARLDAFRRIQTLEGSGDDQVQGRNAATDWVYDSEARWTLFEPGTDTNPLIAFTGMSQVIGGSGDDRFTLQTGTAYAGDIDGGAQTDGSASTNTLTIDGDPSLWYLDGRTDDAVVELGNEESRRLNAFSGIQMLQGSGDDQVQGRNDATDWSYGADDHWTLFEPDTNTNPLIAFSGMSKVVGGRGDDKFTLQSGAVYAGQIDGGEPAESTNTLTIKGDPSLWYLDGRTDDAVVELGNE